MAPQGPEPLYLVFALAPSIHVTLYADLFDPLLLNPIIYTNKRMEIHQDNIAKQHLDLSLTSLNQLQPLCRGCDPQELDPDI